MHTSAISDDNSHTPPQITLSTKCGNGACIGVERDQTGALRIVNVKDGATTTGFAITDVELRAFIEGVVAGDFNHILSTNASETKSKSTIQ